MTRGIYPQELKPEEGDVRRSIAYSLSSVILYS
jgi:hypothetical protein